MGGKVVIAEGAEIHFDLVTIPHDHAILCCQCFSFNLPRTSIANGETMVIAWFTLPTGKTLSIIKAQIANDSGASVANLIIEAYDNTGSASIYSTNSNTVQEDAPLAESGAGKDVEIRVVNTSGGTVTCQGFMVVIIMEAAP